LFIPLPHSKLVMVLQATKKQGGGHCIEVLYNGMRVELPGCHHTQGLGWSARNCLKDSCFICSMRCCLCAGFRIVLCACQRMHLCALHTKGIQHLAAHQHLGHLVALTLTSCICAGNDAEHEKPNSLWSRLSHMSRSAKKGWACHGLCAVSAETCPLDTHVYPYGGSN